MGADNSNLSPEKQLLKFIEESEPSAPKAPVVTVRAGGGLAALSPGVIESRASFIKEKILTFGKSWQGPADIKKINGVFTLAVFVIGAYFLASSVILALKLSELPAFSFKVENSANLEMLKLASQLKAQSYYMEKVRSRDIFKIGRQVTEQGTTQEKAALSQAEQEAILSKYRVVGISWSDNPDVMIEDIAAHRTHFLKRGQVIGDIKIKAILKDKVILEVKGGQEMEMR